MKWILRSLGGTSTACIEYGQTGDKLVGFMDSNYGRGLDDRKYTARYVFCPSGSAISWRSGLHEVVALSTTEAEYMTIT